MMSRLSSSRLGPGLLLAVGLLAGGPARAQTAYPQCDQLVMQSVSANAELAVQEAGQEAARQRLDRYRKAVATASGMSAQQLDAAIPGLEGAVATYREQPSGEAEGKFSEEAYRRREGLLVAEGVLEIFREAAVQSHSGRAFDPNSGGSGRRLRAAETELAAKAAGAERARAAGDAARERSLSCYRQAGAPWLQAPRREPPSNSAGQIDVSGAWESRATPSGPAQPVAIAQQGQNLRLTDEFGGWQAAQLEGDVISAQLWRGGLVGKVSADRREIRWDNGMVWRRR
jgi:hypothetical protein